MTAQEEPVPPSLLSAVLRGGAWTLACRFSSVLFAFGIASVLARMLTTPDMARYFLAMSVAAGLGLTVQLGLPGLTVRAVSHAVAQGRDADARAFARTVLFFCTKAGLALLSLAMLPILFFRLFWPDSDHASDSVVLLIVVLTAGAIALQSVLSEVYRGYNKIRQACLFGGSLAAGASCTAIAFVSMIGRPLTLTQALIIGFCALVSSIAIALSVLPHGCSGSAPSMGRLLVEARPFWGNSLATFFFFHGDLWVAALLLAPEQVALYGAASRLVQPLTFPIEAAEAPLPPVIVRLFGQGKYAELQHILRRTAQLQTALVAFGSIVLIAGGAFLLSIVFGRQYAEGASILALLSMGWLVRATMGAHGHALMLTRHAGAMMRLTIAWSVASAPLQMIAGMLWGGIGIAVAAAFMLGSLSVAGAILTKHKLGINVTVFATRHHEPKSIIKQ